MEKLFSAKSDLASLSLETLLPGTEAPKMRASVSIKSVSDDEQIVYGEVYAPYVIDSHGEMMLPDAVKQLAHRFLVLQKNAFIDVMHNNIPVKASVVESYIARAGDPLYNEGAWVLAVQIFDQEVWAEVKAGKLNGYSLEAWVYKYDADVVFDYLPVHMGFTEENDGHFHAFYVEVGNDGRVVTGMAGSDEDGHTHKISAGTATDVTDGHAHRYFLNDISDDDEADE
jgi:hypothetical protein